jgi:hypothetical protein
MVIRSKRGDILKKRIAGLMTIGSFGFMFQGCASSSMNEITEKIVKVETPKGQYKTVNKSSGAYGRYQIMPKTAKHYTKKLNMNHREWKRPENQDKIYMAILSDNVNTLKKNGYDINAFTVYGCHQQGASGFDYIMKHKNLNAKTCMRLRRNLPRKYKHIKNERLRVAWINYWSKRMKNI